MLLRYLSLPLKVISILAISFGTTCSYTKETPSSVEVENLSDSVVMFHTDIIYVNIIIELLSGSRCSLSRYFFEP